MRHDSHPYQRRLPGVGLLLAAALAWPAIASAGVSGEAVAFRATVLGVSSTLADTGSQPSGGDMLQASEASASIPLLVQADALHATSVSTADAVDSQASLSDISLNVAGNTVSVGFVLAQADAPAGAVPTAASEVEALAVNGVPVYVTGQPNQVVPLAVGEIVLNEQRLTGTGTEVVNAIHVVITGVADVVVGSASAGMGGVSLSPPSLGLLGVASAAAPGAAPPRTFLTRRRSDLT